MAKKQGSDEFTHNPFGKLKGLPVSGAGDAAGKQQQSAPPAKAAPRPEPVSRDDLDFRAAMRDLGLGGGGTAAVPPTAPPSAAEPEEDGRALMLEALGQMAVCFIDPEEPAGEGERARPRRMRQLERGELLPTAELDLHGIPVEGAVQRAAWFLQSAQREGHEVVRLITGAGHRSKEGPVIRPLIERYLASAEGRVRVVEWSRAPQRLGGEGALIAFLHPGR